MKITDEAVEAVAKALNPDLWADESLVPEVLRNSARWQKRHDVRAALKAALPHLEGATPAREHLAKVIDPDAFDDDKPKSKANAAVLQWAARRHMALQSADRLLAAGLFGEGATPAIDREALWDAISAVRDSYPRLSNDAPTDEVIDAILPLIGGAQ